MSSFLWFYAMTPVVVVVGWHSRSGGNVLYQPLDSSAFVPDTALPPRPGGHPSRGGELEPPRRLFPTPLYNEGGAMNGKLW